MIATLCYKGTVLDVHFTVGVMYHDRKKFAIARMVVDEVDTLYRWPAALEARRAPSIDGDQFVIAEPGKEDKPWASIGWHDDYQDFLDTSTREGLFMLEVYRPGTADRAVVVEGTVLATEPFKLSPEEFKSVSNGDYVYPAKLTMPPGGLA